MFQTEQDALRSRRQWVAGEVRAVMGRKNLTAVAVATACGMPPATLSRKLNAHSSFTVDELLDIADALDVSPVVFLTHHEAQAAS